MDDLISRQAAVDLINEERCENGFIIDVLCDKVLRSLMDKIRRMPPAQSEDYTELKREFLRMALYIDVLLECSDEQKETLIGFISRLAEFMPWKGERNEIN